MTKGYQLTFYTEKNRRHGHQSVVECLLSIAKLVGIHGATVVASATRAHGTQRASSNWRINRNW
ncbi:hypothetical protein R69746_04049 [Paraburkholderia aspalathi]|uniref:DUF190 domain-containing protein n=1 Tax=Paraburkholderia aspalathi TaxID=1324617 RepID=UPI001B2D8196|nr:DUF190 domain-containing protein [Paraburkholderia aspalathi]CAE6775607.1 hypothetical protein R69746_04049 [Paraburkholderia aspalathi]